MIKALLRSQQSSYTIRSETEITSKARTNAEGPDVPESGEPIEGGPKTAETPPEDIASRDLLSAVKISPDLTGSQRALMEEVISRNTKAFGLDGRLGQYDDKVVIKMKPEAKPISLPPFPLSPANRSVMDKQIDSWLSLGVIEPSTSPWGAPAFITYRNEK
ncbi:hypothetical protein CYLTODRAFT_362974, partial [Cylindrobasidium torrendii FP15055 ss-10]